MGVLQHVLGQGRILLSLFSISLVLFGHGREVIPCRSNTSSWALLNAISPLCRMENQIIRCSSAEAFVTVKDNAMPLRGWERCSPLPPWTLLAAPALFPAPGWNFICPRQGMGRFSVGRMVTGAR